MALVNFKPIEELLSFEVNSSHQMVLDLIQVYFDLAPDLVQKIQSCLQTRDLEALRLAAHSLKSSSRALGCEDLGNLCYEIEVLVKKQTFPEVEQIQNLKVVFDESLSELKQICADLSMKKSA